VSSVPREKYLRRFCELHAGVPALLREAVASGAGVERIERVSFAVHKMQGSAAQLGLSSIRALGFALERALRTAPDADAWFEAEAPLVLAVASALEPLLLDATPSEHLPPLVRELVRELDRTPPRDSEVIVLDQGLKPLPTTKIS
jgi:HPt (histidine-containing phosphotransfer) domain-containing protein